MDKAPTQRLLHDPVGQGIADHRRLVQQLCDVVQGRQILSPAKFIEMMSLDIRSFADNAQVDEEAVIRAPATESIQSYIRTNLRVLAAVVAASGDGLKGAIVWYRNEPLALFDCKTAETLVAEGRADDVIDLLESYQAGFVG